MVVGGRRPRTRRPPAGGKDRRREGKTAGARERPPARGKDRRREGKAADMPDDAGIFSGVFGRGRVGAGSMAGLEAMLEVEAALARALERAGLAPEGAGAAVTEAARPGNFDVAELGALAALTGNPVPALARALAGKLPKAAAGAVHHGATSQDILDTAMMLLAARGIDVILADLAAAARAAAGLAAEHRSTIMIGRTLLQQAVPVTFGLVAAGWLTGIDEA